MRHLYIIGNGFDLAHGLKTGYGHFIVWYLNNTWKYILDNLNKDIVIDDGLIWINRKQFYSEIPKDLKIEKVSDFQMCIDEFNRNTSRPLHIKKSRLLESILEKNGWADIEREYFQFVKKQAIETTSDSIKQLNDGFENIKKQFETYLRVKILPETKSIQKIGSLESIFQFGSFNGQNETNSEEHLFLNFNYTNTFRNYYFSKSVNKQIIDIHGNIEDPNPDNPIIFGYGDEMDDDYRNIENMDDNEYLKNMKSFGYFQTENYKKLIEFMNKDGDFKTHIIGHSLGLSDRLLLNNIFEHKHCTSIEIHYCKFETGDNYYELARNMSRHFNSEMKGKMREVVVPYNRSKSMNK